MTKITAQLVNELRKRTGAGLMDCKRALEEFEGDLEKAAEHLRIKGIAAADKKAGRATKEGKVKGKVSPDGSKAALVMLACETDFVSRNEQFVELADKVVDYLLENGEVDSENLPAELVELIKEHIAKFGENIVFAGSAYYEKSGDQSLFTVYEHLGGRIGVLLEAVLSDPSKADDPAVAQALKDLAMQIAAAMPKEPVAVSRDDLPEELVEKEKEVLRAQAEETGKPPEIVEKIVMGRLNKFFSEVVLLEQPYIREDKKKVGKFLEEVENKTGVKITPLRFARLEVGS